MNFELAEENDVTFRKVVVPPKELKKLVKQFQAMQCRLTLGQYQQALSIWEYDPPDNIRYCQSILQYKVRNKKVIYDD